MAVLGCCCTSGTPLYILGGTDDAGGYFTTCDKIDMTNETRTSPASGNLSTARSSSGAASNPSTAGYVCGGEKSGATFTNIGDKTVISTDTTSATSSANLSYSAQWIAGLSERSSKAYFAGGNAGFGVNFATANKLTFSSDSNGATSTANLSSARSGVAGMNGDSTKGYWGAGSTVGGGGGPQVTTDKIVFGTDTTAAQASANLTTACHWSSAGGDGSAKGYWFNGDGGGFSVTFLDKIVVSTDTTSALSNPNFTHDQDGYGSDGVRLMVFGGIGPTGTTSSGNKVTFATDTGAGVGCSLSSTRDFPCGFSGAGL